MGQRSSLFSGPFHKRASLSHWSDVDLAAWGIAPEEYFSAASAAMGMGLDSGIKVDLIDPESCSPEFRAEIEKDGIAL